MNIVEISFYKTKSKNFERARALAASFPSFSFNDDFCVSSIANIFDYCKLQSNVYELIHIVKKWKRAEIILDGKIMLGECDYNLFVENLREKAGKYKKLIRTNTSNVSLGDVTIEDLPLPIVYYPNLYGAFFGFAKTVDSKIVFCECERKAIENYVKLRRKMPLKNYTGSKTNPLGSDFFPQTISELSTGETNPLSKFEFGDGICFRCNKKVPRLTYCLPMYGGSFAQHYGWYIKQEYFRLGIDTYQIKDFNILQEECDPQLYDDLSRLSELYNQAQNNRDIDQQKKISEIKKKIDKTIENSVRIQLGYRKIGDSWVSETILAEIINGIFPSATSIRHYRPSWLEGLELDIFLPEKNIAFEYQGIQHFKAIDHWGGEEQLTIQQEHDARKKRICTEKGVNLIYINYNDPLTTEFVVKKIADSQQNFH